MNKLPNYSQLDDSINNFSTGLIRSRSHRDNFTPAELQIDNNISTILSNLAESSLPLTPENLNWLIQQISATPDAVTAGFVAGRMIAIEEANNAIQKVDNSFAQLANSYLISIDIPTPYDRSNEHTYYFKQGFIQGRADFNQLSPEERQIDKNISAILAKLGKISIPCNGENIAWIMQQLGIKPNLMFVGFVAGRIYTGEELSRALGRTDDLLAGIDPNLGYKR
jgi:hypothetical protein